MKRPTGTAAFPLGTVLLMWTLLAVACSGATPPVTPAPLATPSPTPSQTIALVPAAAVSTPTPEPTATPTPMPTPEPTATPIPTPTPDRSGYETPAPWPTVDWPTPSPTPELVQNWTNLGQEQHPETKQIALAFFVEATFNPDDQGPEYSPTLMVRCEGRPSFAGTGSGVIADGYTMFLFWSGPIGGGDEVLDSNLRWDGNVFEDAQWRRVDDDVIALAKKDRPLFLDFLFVMDHLDIRLRDSQDRTYEASFPITGFVQLWKENDIICSKWVTP